MDSDPHLSKNTRSSEIPSSSKFIEGGEQQQIPEEEDPYSLNGPSIALVGLSISVGMLGIPLGAVFFDRPADKESILNTVSVRDGSQSSPPITFPRFSKPGG